MMKFNHAIMNPPYGDYHLPILRKVTEELVDLEFGGEIVSLQPCRWILDPLARYKKSSDAHKMEQTFNGKIKELDVLNIDEKKLGIMFQAGIFMQLGIFHIAKSGSYEYWRQNSVLEKVVRYGISIKKQLEQNKIDGYRACIPIIQSSHTLRGFRWKGRYLVSGYFDGRNEDGTWWSIPKMKNSHYAKKDGEPLPNSIQFETKEELQNFIDSTRTKFFRYLLFIAHIDIQVPNNYLPFMVDYTEPWTNERFYKTFKLTEEEIKQIEENEFPDVW